MLFIFLIQHSSEKPVRTHRTKMYTKCKFKNMSKNITYSSYRPIISNYYNLVLMLVNQFSTATVCHTTVDCDRDCDCLSLQDSIFDTKVCHRLHPVEETMPWRSRLSRPQPYTKLEPRSNRKPKTQTHEPVVCGII